MARADRVCTWTRILCIGAGSFGTPPLFLLPRQRPGETRLPDTWPPGTQRPAHAARRARGGAREQGRANKTTRRPREQGEVPFTAPGPGAPDMWLEWWHKPRPPAGSAPAETWPRGRHCFGETQLPPARPEARTPGRDSRANKREQARTRATRVPAGSPQAGAQMLLAPRIRDMWLGSRIW